MCVNLKIVAALSENRVIGKDNTLPWYFKEDLNHFKNLTYGSSVIMGRNTFESIYERLNGPLPGRENIVLTSRYEGFFEGGLFLNSLEEVLKYVSDRSEAFVIGGEKVFRSFFPFVEGLELTLIRGFYEGDSFFPKFDEKEWVIKSKVDKGVMSFLSYVRVRS